MGTRGIYGMFNGHTTKIAYNHYDSYPSNLGIIMKKFIEETSDDDLKKIFKNIILVDEDKKPTPEQAAKCLNKQTFNKGVSSQSYEDWYCLLRGAQGSLAIYKDEPFYMIDGKEFIQDSLFCEWGYIINLKTHRLEVYKGFQKKPNRSRYSKDFEPEKAPSGDIYYPCKLIKSFDLDKLRLMTNDSFIKALDREEEE